VLTTVLTHHAVPASACFLLGIVFDPKHGVMYLQNLGFTRTAED
jgi:hypothetical protein